MHRDFPLVGAVVLLIVLPLVLLNVSHASAAPDRNAVLDLAFPVAGSSTYDDTYTANRDGGDRRHQATDVFGVKGQAVHAVVSGEICFAPGIDEPMPGYGYMLRICRDGVTYSYIHLNNDTPGTDDGQGGHERAYAPGIRVGVQVTRGQLIGWLGDSGNAEDTPPHLHFSIFDTAFEDPELERAPWRQHYRNPYPSLVAAEARGEVPGATSGAIRLGHRGEAVQAWQEALNRALDAGLGTDGVFGPATDAATRAFQEARGLEVDGIVGPATLAAIETVTGTPVAAAGDDPQQVSDGTFPGRLLRLTDPMLRGEDVREWQARMRERGWRGADGAPLEVDGWFGPDSDRAARLFQEEKGLTVDGVIGPSTWAAVFD